MPCRAVAAAQAGIETPIVKKRSSRLETNTSNNIETTSRTQVLDLIAETFESIRTYQGNPDLESEANILLEEIERRTTALDTGFGGGAILIFAEEAA
jgi:hypothetical protein